jgi:hypothetical protein
MRNIKGYMGFEQKVEVVSLPPDPPHDINNKLNFKKFLS